MTTVVEPQKAAEAPVRSSRSRPPWLGHVGWAPGVVLAVLMIGYFSINLPGTYATWANFQSVANQQIGLLVLALGVTVVLLIGEFDLSFASTIGLSGSCAILTMSALGGSTFEAVLVAAIIGIAVGVVNGVAITSGRAPAFIVTLAVGFVASGLEEFLTGSKTITNGVTDSYIDLTLVNHLGFPFSTWAGIFLVVALAIALGRTTYGRRVKATGINPTAVRLAGISVQSVRISAFVLMGLFAGLVGVFVTSQSASSYPNSGAGLLLPPYAAVFLGAALVGRGRFSVLATVFGVFFLAALDTGLVMLNYPSAVIQLIEGGVLILAVILARQERRA
ncbi:MAG: transporter permease [Subtercola sp.]|nr:transporter permease [Subtercola sp.]